MCGERYAIHAGRVGKFLKAAVLKSSLQNMRDRQSLSLLLVSVRLSCGVTDSTGMEDDDMRELRSSEP